MDTKSKSFSHSLIVKISLFLIVVLCFSAALMIFTNSLVLGVRAPNLSTMRDENFFQGNVFTRESMQIFSELTNLIVEKKNEEHILSGATVTEDELKYATQDMLREFRIESNYYDHSLSEEENYETFFKIYESEIFGIRETLIQRDIEGFSDSLRVLNRFEGLLYYASDGENVITNAPNKDKEFFQSLPAHILFCKSVDKVYPSEISESDFYRWRFTRSFHVLDRHNVDMFIGFTDQFLTPRIEAWEEEKALVTNNIYKTLAFLLVATLALILLTIVIGRKFFGDKKVQQNVIDKLYVDVNLVLCAVLIIIWIMLTFGVQSDVVDEDFTRTIVALITMSIATGGLLLVLSIVKHIKRGTFIKHSATYKLLYTLVAGAFNSKSATVVAVLIAVAYPTALVFIVAFLIYTNVAILVFVIPPVITLLFARIALKKVKEFNSMIEVAEKIRNGEVHEKIEVTGEGDFAKLADNINSIADGLSKALESELRSERLKAELITNVSHDLRTPLTSIITYVDLLKKEDDVSKREEYVEVIEKKSHKLKTLTDDLFEASKASSGNIPVVYGRIDFISLITQGLGELNDEIEKSELEFRFNYPKEKAYIKADGKLLWRAIGNLVSNTFKYALKESRVYLDIEDTENEVVLTIKNVSAYELNVTPDELIERFKRGDESRTSDGSGLGLSIAKSLIEIQNGSFDVEIDGDLFKAIVRMPKF
ncbi:MAG: histidine kinase dimerization/phospho-acceptor domain-containing protein [Alkaliphilus sp.]